MGLDLGNELGLGLELQWLATGNCNILHLDHCWQRRECLGAQDGVGE